MMGRIYLLSAILSVFVDYAIAFDPPRIVTLPQNQTVLNNGVASFECEAVGYPKPQIEWRKNGKRVTSQRYTVRETSNGSVLRIDPVKSGEDDATYECVAENGVGEPVRAIATLSVLADGGASIVCANRKSVLMVDARESHKSEEIVTGLNRSVAVDYHYNRGLIVWTDVETEKIYSAPIAGLASGKEHRVLVEVCVTPDGVAVDWVHDNVYWTDADKDVIGVARLGSPMHKTLLHEELHEPRAMVLHPEEGLMFWTDWGRVPRIERAGMDGSQRTPIVTHGIRWPNGLALDIPSRRLYWIDGSTRILSSSNYDGREENVIITSFDTPIKHPFSLDILGDWLYWTEWASGREGLYKVNKKNATDRHLSKILGGKGWDTLMGLRVYDSSKQPPGVNRCGRSNGGCTHLCLPGPGDVAYSCACPDGILPSDNCSATPLEWLISSTNERHNQEEPVAVSSIPAGAIVGIVLGVAALATVTFYVHRMFLKRRNQSAAMTSQGWTGVDNPVYRETTQQHRVCFEKTTADGDPNSL